MEDQVYIVGNTVDTVTHNMHVCTHNTYVYTHNTYPQYIQICTHNVYSQCMPLYTLLIPFVVRILL